MGPVRSMLDLSTMHLPEHLGDGDSHPGLPAVDGVVAYRLPYGFLMWVPDDPVKHAADYGDPDVEGGVPPEILCIQIYARQQGCEYVMFDRDADAIADLPTWNW